jgi:hypothetical protein
VPENDIVESDEVRMAGGMWGKRGLPNVYPLRDWELLVIEQQTNELRSQQSREVTNKANQSSSSDTEIIDLEI